MSIISCFRPSSQKKTVHQFHVDCTPTSLPASSTSWTAPTTTGSETVFIASLESGPCWTSTPVDRSYITQNTYTRKPPLATNARAQKTMTMMLLLIPFVDELSLSRLSPVSPSSGLALLKFAVPVVSGGRKTKPDYQVLLSLRAARQGGC